MPSAPRNSALAEKAWKSASLGHVSMIVMPSSPAVRRYRVPFDSGFELKSGAGPRVRDLRPESERELAALGGTRPERDVLAGSALDERRLADARLPGHERERAASGTRAVHHAFEVGARVFASDAGSRSDVVDSVARAHPVDRTGPSAR